MSSFNILNLKVETTAKLDINIKELNKLLEQFQTTDNFILTVNFTNDKFLSLFYNYKYKQLAMLLLNTKGNTLVDNIVLTDKEYKLFKISLRILLSRLKLKQYDYSDTRGIVKLWLTKLGEIKTKHKLELLLFYKNNNMNFDEQSQLDAKNISKGVCKEHKISSTDIMERAYLYRTIQGDIKEVYYE